MEIKDEKTGFSNPLVRQVGCYGCLMYVILFFTAGGVITSFGLNTLWVIPFMVLFVLVWGGLFWWAVRKSKKEF